MVPAAPIADAGEAQVDAAWLRKIARWLRLGRDNVAILIEQASIGGLRPLFRSLMEAGTPPWVCFRAPQLASIPTGGLAILYVRASELPWLNLNRPIINNRRLRLLLWLEFPLHELRDGAPDFFDWISHVVQCPESLPSYLVRNFIAMRDGGHRVAWNGGDVEAVARAAGSELVRFSPHDPFDVIVERLGDVGGAISCWSDCEDPRDFRRVELALRDVGQGFAVADRPLLGSDDGWLPTDGDAQSWPDSVEAVGRTSTMEERSALAQAVALAECEPGALALIRRLWRAEAPRDRWTRSLVQAEDPAVELADAVRMHGLQSTSVATVLGLRAGHERTQHLSPRPLEVRLAAAWELRRTRAWVRAADRARYEGQLDAALLFAERAVGRAVTVREQQRASLALAMAARDIGEYSVAHEQFDALQEEVEGPSPLRAVVLTEQAVLLYEQELHEDACAAVEEAIGIWVEVGRRPLEAAWLRGLWTYAGSLRSTGARLDGRGLSLLDESWPPWSSHAVRFYRNLLVDPVPWASHRVGTENLVHLVRGLVDAEQTDEVPRLCRQMLACASRRYGTQIHPHSVSAYLISARVLGHSDPLRADQYTAHALKSCKHLYGERPHVQTLAAMSQKVELLRKEGAVGAVAHLSAQIRDLRTKTAVPHRSMEVLFGAMTEVEDRLQKRVSDGPWSNEEIYMRYARKVVGFFSARFAPAVVSDLTQETFLRLFSRRSDGRPFDPNLVLGVANTVAREFWANTNRDRLVEEPDEQLEETSLPSPDMDVHAAELQGLLSTAMRQLPEHLRVILEYHYIDGLSYGEISESLGLSPGTVASRSRQARLALGKALADAL